VQFHISMQHISKIIIPTERAGYRQVPISAGKHNSIKPKTIDIGLCLIAGANHGTCGQAMNYVAVIYEQDNPSNEHL